MLYARWPIQILHGCFNDIISTYLIAFSIATYLPGCFVSMDDFPSLSPGMRGSCHGKPVAYIPMCDDGNDNDQDTCTSDCRCGVDSLAVDKFGTYIHIAFSPADGPHANECYLRVRLEEPWNFAKSYCETFGLQLAVLEDSDELLMIKNALLGTTSHSHWIGAYRTDQANPMSTDMLYPWEWLNGASLSVEDHDLWGEGEPNNLGDEFCAQIFEDNNSPKKDGKLNDASCEQDFYFLCKTPLSPTINP